MRDSVEYRGAFTSLKIWSRVGLPGSLVGIGILGVGISADLFEPGVSESLTRPSNFIALDWLEYRSSH